MFLKEIPFASLTNAMDMKIERVLTGFQPIKKPVNIEFYCQTRILYSIFFFFLSDAPSPCAQTQALPVM